MIGGKAIGLAMSGKRVSLAIVLVALGLAFAAWIDGGEEPLRPISQSVQLPESLK